jgi:hypothetical protein
MPQVTFFCELEPDALEALINNAAVLRDLQHLKARLSLGILDFSPQRAEAVRRLNQAGVPVIAWLLLPKDQGYWFNAHNAAQAEARYQNFQHWTAEQNLIWAGVGLDIEPDIRDFARFTQHPWKGLLYVLPRLAGFRQAAQARRAYCRLAQQIHKDGYVLESYQFPLIYDERRAGSTILQRLAGLVDIPVDREVWMIYTSYIRPIGPGVLSSYMHQAQAVALGITGSGVEAEGIPVRPPLTWNELADDLRLAYSCCDDIYIFCLEGCVQQGFMEPLKSFTWDQPILLPQSAQAQIDAWRGTLGTTLWFLQSLPFILLALAAGWMGWKMLRRKKSGAK